VTEWISFSDERPPVDERVVIRNDDEQAFYMQLDDGRCFVSDANYEPLSEEFPWNIGFTHWRRLRD
jgi:hypothetical protein